ncbi:hypothetical protein HJC23_005836 [Cyclotella cryptica]|uniref:DOMON domain-containing protein n=1 Tax=Cyclotella cryptica TaxID=29204 RepID=A0ABD3QZ49_9STRA|eukprot:CCRYP_000338-RD/>CCRYP_000338-RD protein AED:0.17 eAED:0.17 QI:4681/1/1/1/0.2/0/6/2889/407
MNTLTNQHRRLRRKEVVIKSRSLRPRSFTCRSSSRNNQLSDIMSFFKSFFLAAALLEASSSASAQMLGNWDVNFLSLDTDFSVTGTDELVLHYEIGKNRTHQIDLFDKGCANPILGIAITFNDTKTNKDQSHDLLDIALDVERSNIATSNLWDPFSNKFEMCLRLQLLSGDMVIKEDSREISVAFDFSVDFTVDAVGLGSVSKSSGVGSTRVDSYVEACKCGSIETFECNDDVLVPNQELYLCIRSNSPDIEIDTLHSLLLTQDSETVLVVDASLVQDETISAMYMVPEHNGVAVAMLVPAAFWNYGGQSSVSLTGTVYLKLVGSRRLAFNIPSFEASRIMRSEVKNVGQIDDQAVGDASEAATPDKSSFQVKVGLDKISSENDINSASSAFVSFGILTVVFACLVW